MQPAQRFVRGPRREQREYVRGVLQQPARFAGGEVPTAQFEVLVQRLRFGGAVEMFLEALQQAIVDPPHDRRAAVEALHHLLDRERIAIVGIAEAFGQQLLEVEAQAFLAPSGDQVQAEAEAAERAALAIQRHRLIRAEVVEPDQRIQFAHAEAAQRHPAQHVQVAQAAGTVLEVGFEVVAGVAEARVPLRLFAHLGLEEGACRPHPLGRDRILQALLRSRASSQRAGFDQGGEHGLVCGGLGALRGRTRGLAGLQPGIPQQGEEARKTRLLRVLRIAFGQHQQVDVGMREQFAAAVAADREQGKPGDLRDAALPRIEDQLVDRARAQRDQLVGDLATVETPGQLRIGLRQRSARGRGPGRIPIGTRRDISGSRSGVGRRVRAHRSLSSPGVRVRISTPSRVTATVCSHCADNLRSLVTTVQPSGSNLVWRAPSLIIGSMVKVMPSFSTMPSPGRP